VRGVVIAGAIPVVGLTVVEASNTEFKLRRVDHKLGAECPRGIPLKILSIVPARGIFSRNVGCNRLIVAHVSTTSRSLDGGRGCQNQ